MKRKELKVFYKDGEVGTLAETTRGVVAFQYSKEWLSTGFSISPLSLPLTGDVFVPDKMVFDGLFGVFADSLPDAWGRLLLDRKLSKEGIKLSEISLLDRLAIVGNNGMGALEYIPTYTFIGSQKEKTMDELSDECDKVLSSKKPDDLDLLFSLGGPSGGARPKALLKIDNEEWIVKFPYSKDPEGSGKREYEYSLLAKKVGINMSETKLFPSKKCEGYFGTRRFDRPKTHMISASALLEADFETSLIDYLDLFKLTKIITAGRKEDLENLYLRMCFNVTIGNQDDHLKNFSYLFDDKNCTWRLSPAYDITDTKTDFGEHTTLINGKGTDITIDDLVCVGSGAGLDKSWCELKANEIKKQIKPVVK